MYLLHLELYNCWINMLNLNDRSLNNSHWSDDMVAINFTFFFSFFRVMKISHSLIKIIFYTYIYVLVELP